MAVLKFRLPGSERPSNRNAEEEAFDEEDTIEEGYDDDVDDDGYIDDGREDEEDIERAREERNRRKGRKSSEGTDDTTGETDSDEAEEGKKGRPRRQRTRAEKIRFAVRLVLLLCAAAIICIFLLNQNENTVYTDAEITKTVDVSIPESCSFLNLDGNILMYNKDGVSLMNTQGTSLWNIPYEMQQPLVATSDSVVAIGDFSGSTIYVCNTTGKIGQISTSLPIQSLAVADNGNVAAVLDDSGTIWIYLYDVSGNTIAYIKRSMSQSGYPSAIALSPNGKLLTCAQITADSTDIKTSVVFYNFGSVGQSAVDNAVGGYDYASEVVPYLKYLNDSTMIAVSDARIAFFSGTETPTSLLDAFHPAELEGVYTGGGCAALLFPDTTGAELYDLIIYNSSGKQVGEIKFSMEFTSIQIADERVIINNGQNILIYSITGEERYSGNFGMSVNEVIPTGHANRYVLLTPTDIEEMSLR